MKFRQLTLYGGCGHLHFQLTFNLAGYVVNCLDCNQQIKRITLCKNAIDESVIPV